MRGTKDTEDASTFHIYMSHQCVITVTFLFYAISEGKIRNLGPGNKIGTISGLWFQLGPSPKFGTLLEALNVASYPHQHLKINTGTLSMHIRYSTHP